MGMSQLKVVIMENNKSKHKVQSKTETRTNVPTILYPEDFGAISEEMWEAMTTEESKSLPRQTPLDSDIEHN
jgi:hypothetical protein